MTTRARIGVPGDLIEVPGTSALSHTPERLTSRRVTMGGRRVVQEAVREHREWNVTLRRGSRPRELAGLAALAAGEWGRGPFAFVSEWAQVTNVLTPEASVLEIGQPPDGVMLSGPVTLPDDTVAGRHLVSLHGGDDILLPRVRGTVQPVAVAGGIPVTGSLYTTGGHVLRLQWRNLAGDNLGGESVTAPPTTAPERVHVTATPPADAASCVLYAEAPPAGVILARPAVTWTPHLLPWYPGQGVDLVTVHGLSTDVMTAWMGEGGQRAGLTFTVVEVG